MQRWFIILVILLAGCSKIESYVEDPPSMLKDPHFAQYQENMDNLEHAYLRKEIPYAEYVEKKKQLEDQYNKEAQQRTDSIETEQK